MLTLSMLKMSLYLLMGIISSGFLTISTMWGQWIRSKDTWGVKLIVGRNFDYVKFTHPVRANDLLTTEVEIVGLRASLKPESGGK